MSTRPQSNNEPALSPRAAASQHDVPEEFASIPARTWQEMDLCIRSMLACRFSPDRIHRALKLRHQYGISVRAIDRYCRRLSAAGSLAAERLEHRASRPHAPDAVSTQRLDGHPLSDTTQPDTRTVATGTQDKPFRPQPLSQPMFDALSRQVLDRLAQTLEDQDLTPDQFSRLANALARQQQAFARSRAQKIANARYTHDRLRWKKKEQAQKPTMMTLTERVRRIYGMNMPQLGSIKVPIPPDEYSAQQERALRTKGAL